MAKHKHFQIPTDAWMTRSNCTTLLRPFAPSLFLLESLAGRVDGLAWLLRRNGLWSPDRLIVVHDGVLLALVAIGRPDRGRIGTKVIE